MATTDYYSRPYELVRGQIALMSGKADSALSSANGAIKELLDGVSKSFESFSSVPTFSFQDPVLAPTLAMAPRRYSDSVPGFSMPNFDSIAVDRVDMPGIPDFQSSINGIPLPSHPSPIDVSGKPVKPDLLAIAIPDAPALSLPTMGDLAGIEIPTFTFPELPTFDGTAPVFTDAAPSTLMVWSEPQYQSDNLVATKSAIAAMLAGGTGIPAAVEDALFSRARSRDDMLSTKARQEAFDTFAGRGFAMPPGMLVAQVNAITEENRLKSADNNRDILAKSAQWEIENLRAAVQNGIALEGTLIGLFQQIAQRAFEAAKFQVESQVSLFNAKVGLFNAQQNGYQVAATVYKTRLEGALAKLEVFKAEIAAQQAKGQLNEQTVKVYQARLEAVRDQVEIYKSKMEGAKALSDVNRNIIEGYRADVQAFAEDVAAQKTRFEAYDTETKAYTARVGVVESQARAFAATVQAHESSANVKIKNIDANISAMNAETERFVAKVNAERGRVDAAVAIANNRIEGYKADVSMFVAEMENSTRMYDVQSRIAADRMRNSLAYYDTQIKEYDARMGRTIQMANISMEAMKAAGNMAAQLAAGAYAAMHVSATMSGQASVSSNETFTTNSTL